MKSRALVVMRAPSRARWVSGTRRVMVAAGLGIASFVMAQDATKLAKADVESLVVGKKVQYVSATTGSTNVWDIKSNGSAFFQSPQARYAPVIAGTYTIEDDGSLCFVWRNSDRYVVLQDGCVLFMRDAAKTRIVGKLNPARVIGDLVE